MTNRKRLTKRKPVRKHRTLRRKMRGGGGPDYFMYGDRSATEMEAVTMIFPQIQKDEKILFAATMTMTITKPRFFVFTTNRLLYYNIKNKNKPVLNGEFFIKDLVSIYKSDTLITLDFMKDKNKSEKKIEIEI